MIGGAGNDFMQGGIGSDTYRIDDPHGLDTIFEWAGQASPADRIILPQEVTLPDLRFEWGRTLASAPAPSLAWGEPLQMTYTTFTLRWGEHDGVRLILPHSEQAAGTGIEDIVFGDGNEVPLDTLMREAGALPGVDPHLDDNRLSGSGYLYGDAGDDTLHGVYQVTHSTPGGGHGAAPHPAAPAPSPLLFGVAPSNTFDAVLIGGSGHDRLLGNDIVRDWTFDIAREVSNLWDSGNDYDGGPGNDEIWTTTGSDLIHFGLGDGQDRVTDLLHDAAYLNRRDHDGLALGDPRLNEATAHLDDLGALQTAHRAQLHSSTGTLRFDADIAPADIAVRRAGNDLVFAHSNNEDTIRFVHWFDADINQLERVEFSSDHSYWNRQDISALLDGSSYVHREIPTSQPTPQGDSPQPDDNGPDAKKNTAPPGVPADGPDAYQREQLARITAVHSRTRQEQEVFTGTHTITRLTPNPDRRGGRHHHPGCRLCRRSPLSRHPRTRPPGPVPDPILRSSISNISGSACTRHCVSSMPDRIGSPAQRYNNREAIRPCTTACLAIAAATRGMRGTPSPSRRPTPICNHSMD